IVQHIGARIGADRQLGGAARLAGADIQNVERLARVKTRLAVCTAGRRWTVHASLESVPGRHCAPGRLTGFKWDWWTFVNGPCAMGPPKPCSGPMESVNIV